MSTEFFPRFFPSSLAVAGLLATTLGMTGAVSPAPQEQPTAAAPVQVAEVLDKGVGEQIRYGTAALNSSNLAEPVGYAGRAAGPDQSFGNVHVYTEGVDFSRPVGVVVRLHGDGAYEYHHPGYLLDELADVAAGHNKILVAPLTPDTGNGSTWWRESEANADWLAGLLEQHVLPRYDVNRSDIWWMGYSGGAELLARELILTEPQLVTGGAIMLGGGGRPWGVDAPAVDAAREQVGPLIWVTGTDDDGTDPASRFDALGATQGGAAWYRDQGFSPVHAYYPQGVDHFELAHAAILGSALG